MEMYVDAFTLGNSDNQQRSYGHLTVIAKNEAGYRALIAANNLAHRQFYYRPRITLQQLVDNGWTRDWFILSGCMSSPINNIEYPQALHILQILQQCSAGVFLETMWHESTDETFVNKQYAYIERVAQLHRELGLPVILTNDCHFAHQHDEVVHSNLMRRTRAPSDLEFDGSGFYFKTQAQMQSIANDLGIPNAIQNAVDLCRACELVIPEADQTNWHVPDITGGRPEEFIRSAVENVLQTKSPDYRQRFEYEMSVLRTSSAILNSYLVAYDVVAWCRQRNITIAARGSMGGSLVSHLLGISPEDPIKYNLSFNRAVNPARPTIPDFDLDVSSLHRPEVLEYLRERYAGNIPISAYTHYGPKGAFRKVLRMEANRDAEAINSLCRDLPDGWTDGDFGYDARAKVWIGYADWWENVPPDNREEVSIYKGVFSSVSVHPSGILISGPERPIEHEVPFQYIASSHQLASAYDMYSLKKMGLFKLDVLGLKTLDQLEFMENHTGERCPDDNYDDPQVLKAFGADLLAEIFQMDGYACRTVLRDIGGAQHFNDIVAANTLARPGASAFKDEYRSGSLRLIQEYPLIREVLSETNGLILYQEQVMEIARVLADFDDAEQDDVKESIKYFRHENWNNTIVPLFTARCHAKGIDPTNILQAISKMASYTYNKAHAMSYAAIAYRMMWYKVHHPVAYYAAVFDDSGDKARLILESHFFNVKWNPADINRSRSRTSIIDGQIFLGLSAIKGVGPAAVEAIEAARPYTSLQDLMDRVERRKCNTRVITAMKEAYALHELGEEGNSLSFEEAFGFSMRILESSNSVELSSWQRENAGVRLGGFITSLRPFKVRNNGKLSGQEMARASVVNILGTTNAVFFPDVWRKAKLLVYNGAPVKLNGTAKTSGEFIVESGVVI
jgi:DNA polymerase-3 subunit alpha